MKVLYKEMESCCHEMREVFGNIKTLLEDINNEFNSIESVGCWQGNGCEFYSSKIKKVTGQFETINEYLENNVRYLEDTLAEYNEIDKKIALGVSGIFDKAGSDK